MLLLKSGLYTKKPDFVSSYIHSKKLTWEFKRNVMVTFSDRPWPQYTDTSMSGLHPVYGNLSQLGRVTMAMAGVWVDVIIRVTSRKSS